jgi:hypothetical protein
MRAALGRAVFANVRAQAADLLRKGAIPNHRADAKRTNLDALPATSWTAVRGAAGHYGGEAFFTGEDTSLAGGDTGIVFHQPNRSQMPHHRELARHPRL